MTEKLITVHISEELYERVQEAAEASDRSLETVLLDSLNVLFGTVGNIGDIDAALGAMSDYSDPELWAVVYRRLPWMQSLRLRELNDRHAKGQLTEAETKELDRLLTEVDADMLLRSEALLILKKRGHAVSRYFETTT